MTPFARTLLAALFLLLSAPAAHAQEHGAHHGKVDFATSCESAASQHFDVGLALLHHMMYEQAEAAFSKAAAADPSCVLAHWGTAMTVVHPLWGERPSDAALEKGSAALARAAALPPPTPREAAYLAALQGFFHDWKTTSYPDQLVAFERSFGDLHAAYPDDIDAAAFYALGRLATAPKADKTFAAQQEAGALLEALHQRAPEHPGLFHYIIHAYDNPALADRAIEVARGYDRLAPEVPHALHMPSHIFIRRGYWADAIDWNARSAAAALKQPVGGHTSMHYAHALDYLAYAHLQRGEDRAAAEVAAALAEVTDFQPGLATAYALAAVPARYVLERQAWHAAAQLPAETPAYFPWQKFPGAAAITVFARGLGAARSGDIAAAKAAHAVLNDLHAALVASGETYWAVLADAQRKAVAAWIAQSAGDAAAAARLMRQAADTEDSVDKHPVTPGAVLPARELLGDLLLLQGHPADALAAYEATLAVAPDRFNSLWGAARAAEAAGESKKANRYYARLLEVAAPGDADRPALRQARKAVGD